MFRSNHSAPYSEPSPGNDNLSGVAEDLFSRLLIDDGDDEGRIRSLSTTSYDTYTFQNFETWSGRKFATPLYEVEEHRYYLPVTDDKEARRQYLTHLFWASNFYLVPPGPQSGPFLDFGTGAGYWVQDVAHRFPHHKVIGIDLYYEDMPETPNRSEFEVDDCEGGLSSRREPVSLINLRDSYLWVRDMPLLISRARYLLQPGGYFQNQEFRLTDWISNKPKFMQWRQDVIDSAKNLGVQLHSAEDVHAALDMNGFQDYQERIVHVTLDKRRDDDFFEFMELTVQATLRILVDGGIRSQYDASTLLDEVVQEISVEDCRISLQMHSCWAKSAEVDEMGSGGPP
jgi:hypothetical protein